MSVLVNGHAQPLPEPQTLEALLLMLAPAKPFSVARNGEFVARATYAQCALAPGDSIEIVQATAGG